MSGEFTISQANGVLKPVFGKELINVLPEAAYFQKKYPLAQGIPLVGDHYEVPVAVRLPHGHSFNGSAGAVVALNGPLAGKTVSAQVVPQEYVLREQISYGLLDRAKNGDVASFVNAMSLDGKLMALSARNVLEMDILHGREGIGTVNGAISSHVITLSAASLAPGILAAIEGAKIDVFQSDLSTKRALNLIVSAVDVDAGTITVLDAGLTGADASAEDDASVTTGDVIFISGQLTNGGTFNHQYGLGKVLAATTGTYFNIDKATYSAWRSTTVSSVAEFSISALVGAAVKCMNRGFAEGTLLAVMPPKAWGVIDSALATNENFQGGYTATKRTGTDDIEVKVNGITIKCVPHIFQKQGQIYLLPEQYMKRVGAVDMTFAKAGSEDEFLRDVSGYNAMERQCRAQWQFFLERPSYAAILTGITYA